jgi:hypothetical protein
MSHIAADLAQAIHQCPDAVEHPIERSRQPVQVIASTAYGHAAREVPATTSMFGERIGGRRGRRNAHCYGIRLGRRGRAGW